MPRELFAVDVGASWVKSGLVVDGRVGEIAKEPVARGLDALVEQLNRLRDDAERGSNATLSVDLEAQTIKGPDGGTLHFDIDPARRHTLLEGLDEIGTTLKAAPVIAGFEAKMHDTRPWL